MQKNNIDMQISQKDGMLRAFDEKIRTRDERIKEKDDILIKLRASFDEAKTHVKTYEKKIRELTVEVNDKEAVIAILRDQLLSSKENSKSEKDNVVTCSDDSEEAELIYLKSEVQRLKEDLDKKEKDKAELKNTLEESRKTLSDSLVLWNAEKSEMQRDMNVLEEKVRLYEVYNTQSQGEAVESLKEEAYSYFTQREALNCELASSKIDAEATERTHRVQIARLQTDLNDKLKQLKSEVENNTKLKLEAERLSVQAEKAYRFQQEVRILKAEHQAMKVRYESRLDKMANECNRMVTTIEKLKRQHQVDDELIQKFEQNLTLVSERYTDQLLKADDDQNTMTRQMNEIEELRTHLEEVMNIVRELREKSLDQDRLSKDLVSRMTTQKSRWEMDRVNLVSQINQLEEQLSSSTQQSSRARDIQVNLGISWDKERKEQKRLLAEAHTLALDLQDQLRSRDETFAHEKKEILRQMEGDRMNWMREKREMEKRIAELECADRKLGAIQKRLKQNQEALQEKTDQWRNEQKELTHQLNESRQAHTRDCKRLEEVLAGLVKFKELGSVLVSQSTEQSEELSKNVVANTLGEAVKEVTRAADDLTKLSASSSPETDAPTTTAASTTIVTSASQSYAQQTATTVSSNKSQTKPQTVTTVSTSRSSTTVKSTTVKTSSKISEKIKTLSGKLAVDQDSVNAEQSNASALSSSSIPNQEASSLNRKQMKSKASPSLIIPPTQSAHHPVTMRPLDPTGTRRYDRPPSYTSGTRSAQSSRSTTPEVDVKLDPSTLFHHHHYLHHYNNQQSHSLPKHTQSRHYPQQQQKASSTGAASATKTATTTQSSLLSSSQKPKRPATFIKSLSMEDNRFQDNMINSPLRLYSPTISSQRSSNSASSTPTYPAPYSSFTAHQSPSSLSSIPSALDSNLLSPDFNTASVSSSSSTTSSHHKKFSPRTARKKFFEEAASPPSETNDNALTWPNTKRPTAAPKPLPDANEFRKEAEVEHDLISTKHHNLQYRHQLQDPSALLKMSSSWDEKMHYHEHQSPFYEDESTTSGIDCTTPESSTIVPTNQSASSCLPPTQFSPIPENQQATGSSHSNTSSLPRSSGKSAKEKRKLFFKKSESLESPVGSSIAKAGVSAMPMAAPSGFTPSNFFAAVKGKLKPMLRPNKSQESKVKGQEQNRPPSPLFIPTEVPDINFGISGTTILPVPVPQRTFHDEVSADDKGRITTESTQGRSRQNQRKEQDKSKNKGRSKSMDERRRTDSNEVWRFNETDL